MLSTYNNLLEVDDWVVIAIDGKMTALQHNCTGF